MQADVLPRPTPQRPDFNTTLPLKWHPVDVGKLAGLPAPWPRLQPNFHPHLYDRAQRFWTCVVEDGYQEWLIEPIVTLGESYLRKFDRNKYPHQHYGNFCTGEWLDALEQLAGENILISPILWETLAALGTRDNPLEEDAIPLVKGLPHAWGICDASVHALGKAYELFFHVQERLRQHSGHVLLHNCACNHIVHDVRMVSGSFPLMPDTENARDHQAKAWLDHFMSELYLMFVNGLPFRMNPEDFNSTKVISMRT